MLQHLVKLKLPIMAVLEDDSITPKPEHHALLLKDKMWILADDLVKVLTPAERTTALLGQTLSHLRSSCSCLPYYIAASSWTTQQILSSGRNSFTTVRKCCAMLIPVCLLSIICVANT